MPSSGSEAAWVDGTAGSGVCSQHMMPQEMWKLKNGQLAVNGMRDGNWTTAHGSVDWEGGGEAEDQTSL